MNSEDASARGRRPQRVLFVGRHFWPHLSHDSAGRIGQLCSGLNREGMHVEVLTPKHHANWPDQVDWAGVPVHRPATLPRRDWSMGRYVKHLTHWIESKCPSMDAIVAMSMREEAAAAVEAAERLGIPSIVHDSGYRSQNDLIWSTRSRTAMKTWRLASKANRIVTTTAKHHRDLVAAGCVADRVSRIMPGVRSPAPNLNDRHRARQVLTETNLDMHAAEDSLVVLCIGRMELDSNLHQLSRHVLWMTGRDHNVRVWMIGDGQARSTIHRDLKADGVRDFVAMPGSFAELQDVFAAADMYVQMDSSGLDYFLPAALGHGLPIVAAKNDETREVFPEDQDANVNWFTIDSTGASFRAAMRSAIKDLPAHRQRASLLVKQMLQTQSYQRTIDEYVQLIDRVIARHRPNGDPTNPAKGNTA